MTLSSSPQRENLFIATVCAVGITGLWFWLTWRYGFDLADEGYYWYGAQRVLRGEVPLRDFASYDVGRYYWAAFFMHLMGDDGILGARVSAAVFQMLGTVLGVYVCLSSVGRDAVLKWLFALLVACILTVWVAPYYKAYDHATSIMVVGLLLLMLTVKTPVAWLGAGLGFGIAAMMGRNHGVYGVAAASFIILVLLVNAPSRRAIIALSGYFLLGIFSGFAPTLVMMLAIDGFAIAFMDSIVMMLQYGATNLGLPVPWPWSQELQGWGIVLGVIKLSVGMGFVFLLAFPLLAIPAMRYRWLDLSDDRRHVMMAAIAASIPYAHYSFSRADVVHLALGIFPALIGLLAAGGALAGWRSLTLALGVLTASVATVHNLQPYLYRSLLKSPFVQTDVGGLKLWVPPRVSADLQLANKAIMSQADGSGKFLAVPNMPSIYAIHRTKMPLWETYSLIPRDAQFEAREIKRLESFRPDLVLLSNHALDGNPELRYSRTHPLTYEWITSKYELSDLGPTVYVRKH